MLEPPVVLQLGGNRVERACSEGDLVRYLGHQRRQRQRRRRRQRQQALAEGVQLFMDRKEH